MKVQLAIQGGGAKISALLAVAESLQAFQANNRLQLTRVAGTSAGAIVACVLAAGVDAKLVIQRLRALRANGSEWEKAFPRLGSFTMASGLARKKPFYSDKVLRTLLDEFFTSEGFATLGDIKNRTGVEVVVMATDLQNSQKIVYRDATTSTVNALLDSAGLPFVYRMPGSSNGHIVDGGICENLPSDELKRDPNDGEIVGVSFQKQAAGTSPTTIREYGAAILDAAMSNSVLRARRSVEKVFFIATDIETFDFARAFDVGFGDQYARIKLEAHNFFCDLVRAEASQAQTGQTVVVGDPWQSGDTTFMETLSRIYRLQHEAIKLRFHKRACVVQANCLLADSDPMVGADFVTQQVDFEPVDRPVSAHRAILDPNYSGSVSVSLHDRQGNEIRTEALPGRSGGRRELVIFFDHALEPGDSAAPYRMEIRDRVRNSLAKLKVSGGIDRIAGASPRAVGEYPVHHVVVFPEAIQSLLMVPLEGASGTGAGLMNQADLDGYPAPPLFRKQGWKGTVRDGERFGVQLVRP